MEKQPIIAVKNLSVEYAKTPVFRKINFEILSAWLAVTGPGKPL